MNQLKLSEELENDIHIWRLWDTEVDGENYVPDPHSSQIKCDRCGLSICKFCGVDDPSYEKICAEVGNWRP